MARNQTYKAFTASPSYVMDLNGVLLDSAPVLGQLATEVRGISTYATFVARNDTELGPFLLRLVLFSLLRLVVVRVLIFLPS